LVSLDIIDQSLSKGGNLPYHAKTSYQRDIKQEKANEGELFGGSIIRMGQRCDMPTDTARLPYSITQQFPIAR